MRHIDPDSIRIVMMDLPVSVHGFVVSDGFDFYTIVINPRLSNQMQQEACDHEIDHLINGDLSIMQDMNRDLLQELSADQIEKLRRI